MLTKNAENPIFARVRPLCAAVTVQSAENFAKTSEYVVK